ncbi:MAG: phosphatidate cytidylyltransferase [Selenomonadaceae bacterium]|nr:phosphatidate cytidylyltransferase [Selenomonadaceae bacterium]
MIVRIISGIVGIAIAAVVIQLGGLPFAAFAMLLTLIGWYEYSSMMKAKGLDITFLLGALTLILMLCCAWLGNTEELLAVLTIGMLMIFLMTVLLHGSVRPIDACASIAGVLYIGLPFAHLILLRFLDDESQVIDSVAPIADKGLMAIGNALESLMALNFDVGSAMIWLLFICTWSSDTFAYFVGVAIGSHKLASSISPKKTVEGFIGGVLGTTAMAVLVGHVCFNFPFVEMAILGFILAIVATLGDLVESVMKRFAGIKDSGILLPGHGGMLDRFDSIFFTAPVFYYFIIIAGLI